MVLVVVLGCGGCATPYQQMGFRGGYRDRQLSEGRFFVEVRVNAYASSGTALEYLHRRARDLCTAAGYAEYAIEDSAADADIGVVRTGNTLQAYRKPEMSAIVECRE